MLNAIAALALSLLLTPAEEAPETATSDTIVVTGSPITTDEVADFVRAVTVETGGDQLAAFHAPVCPVSFGLPDTYSAVIEERIRSVAEQAGIEVEDEDCSPNIAVFFANDGAELVTRLRSEHPNMFAGRDASDNRGLVLDEGPVRAWQVLDTRGSDGRPVRRVGIVDLRQFIADPGRGMLHTPRGKVLDGVRPSLLTRSTRQDLALSYVVIDVAAIDGLSLGQVGDHAAMRALAQTDPEDAAATAQPTILTLFLDRKAGRAPAEAMTDWDMAFLKSLYETRRTVSAGLQRSNMTRMVQEELEAGEPDSKQAN